MSPKHCLFCGMEILGPKCLKCDSVISEQTDGSTVWVDIAHNGQTVIDAMRELEYELRVNGEGLSRYLGLIVGNGKIREEVLARLGDLKFRGDIQGFKNTDANPGQIMVQIKP